jgi:hypothetical protein
MLQVDGEIEGEFEAAEGVAGEKGKVAGMVAGRQVVVRGRVCGVVCGQTVALQASSQVDGDLHHMSLAIEQGASSRVVAGRAFTPSWAHGVRPNRGMLELLLITFASYAGWVRAQCLFRHAKQFRPVARCAWREAYSFATCRGVPR